MARSTMTKMSLRTIAAHKLRLGLTVLAVVLGTAFISGAFMFTNTLSQAFDAAINNTYRGVDAVASSADPTQLLTLDDARAVAEDPQVSRVTLPSQTTVVIARRSGEELTSLQTAGGASYIGIWYPADQAIGEQLSIVEGRGPATADEVVINAAAAQAHGVAVGDEVVIVDPASRHNARVSGIYDTELDQPFLVQLRTTEAGYLEHYTDGEHVGQILVDGAGDPEQLVSHLSATYPHLTIETGQALADETAKTIQSALSFVNYFLIAFGVVALLVGTFLIANTFSMIVAQRTKEFALLRALGASRRQITRSVVGEAIVIGVLGSSLGVVAGAGLVAAIRAFMASQGSSLPGGGLGWSTGSVVVPIVLGTAVTVFSAWSPARRAGRVQPVEAMRSQETASEQSLFLRTLVGIVVLALGLGAALAGAIIEQWSTGQRALCVGTGAVALIGGFYLAGPALSMPVVPTFGRVIGWPFKAVGRLASTNTLRNPRRTSATAFALALGIALVTVIGMLGSTMKSSISDVLDTDVSTDYLLTGPITGSFPVPNDVPETAQSIAGVGSVTSYLTAPVTVGGYYDIAVGAYGATSVMDGNPANMLNLTMASGSADISDGGVLVSAEKAAELGWQVGDSVELAFAEPVLPPVPVEIVGTFEPHDLLRSFVVSQVDVEQLGLTEEAERLVRVGVNAAPGVAPETLREPLNEAMRDFVVVEVLTEDEFAGVAGRSVNDMLAVLYALLSLAIIIAVLGIVNTLTLSVIERRQEFGMLRAVGSQRSQIRRMVSLESVQVAVFGAASGLAIGGLLGWAFITVLAEQGLDGEVGVPWLLMAVVLAGSIAVGLLAAVLPARRAAATPPLEAIAGE
ncbi:ABC transporter permease [Corynebacterium uterequi]|uniref:ABC superfamily ATP binding cassette transporter permease protein n=1 Tax=Corynebacterium uterequi TaxID=1072256 RepID=A0A0G3HIM3_9CORY|nr:FtsX-like permease family protein [Corynebacterium uterequi]AKK11788.1 ABC superfamily ATP binding cassette transporter permease protein [Corynebacterium uterequi]